MYLLNAPGLPVPLAVDGDEPGLYARDVHLPLLYMLWVSNPKVDYELDHEGTSNSVGPSWDCTGLSGTLTISA